LVGPPRGARGSIVKLARWFRVRLRAELACAWAGARRMAHAKGELSRDKYCRFSVVTGCYNSEPYLDDYFHSLTRQTLGFRDHIEIIIVDDGSNDGSWQVMQKWRRRYPENITCIHQLNSGVAAARNSGLEHAHGQWVTFIDSDDYVRYDYFEQVSRSIAIMGAEAAYVKCNSATFFEKTGITRRRSSLPTRYINLIEEPELFQVTVNNTFFRTVSIRQFALSFNPLISPVFEDSEFANRYICSSGCFVGLFVGEAVYCYRKRSDEGSLSDTCWAKRGMYGAVPMEGYLPLLQHYRNKFGSVPKFLENLILHNLHWYVGRLCDADELIHFLSPGESERLQELLLAVLEFIGPDTILDYAALPLKHKVALLALKKADLLEQRLLVSRIDTRRGQLALHLFDGGSSHVEIFRNGCPIEPLSQISFWHHFNRRPYVRETLLWISTQGLADLRVSVNGRRAALEFFGKTNSKLTAADLALAKRLQKRLFQLRWWHQVWPVALARSAWAKRCYGGTWLFMDRVGGANAEHLYRWVSKHTDRADRIWFVVSRSSRDWKRLKQNGFRLLPYGGLRHRLAFLNADCLISSHSSDKIFEPFGDAAWRFIPSFAFLGHGVIAGAALGVNMWDNLGQIAAAWYACREVPYLSSQSSHEVQRERWTSEARSARTLATDASTSLTAT
jgi:glycosyltransferase involved in cell wall biosynthesis